jgi:anti-sigma-K factor RskA
MSEPEDKDLFAAEYVLGTLDQAERRQANVLRASDTAFEAMVQAWETRLAPLLDPVSDVEPPSHLFPLIAQLTHRPDAAEIDANVVQLKRSLRLWRGATLVVGALAAALVFGIGLRESMRPVTPASYVAVLQKDAASPAFILSVDLQTRSLTVRPVAPQPEPGRAYELWLVDASLAGPKSLGIIGDLPFSTTRGLPFESAMVRNATYAVSIEPPGGSPTGSPTGPVVYAGKLIQTTP